MKVIVIILIISLWGCAKDQATTKHAEVAFTIDHTLLSQEYICSETSISFNLPKNWEEVSSQLMISIKKNTQTMRDSSHIQIEPLIVFMNKEKSFTCFLSLLNDDLSSSNIGEVYLDEFKSINQDLPINEGLFTHNDLDFHQLLFTQNDFVTIKLIALNRMDKTFMIDYNLPIQFYEEELRAIESSIGTIKSLK